MATRRRFIRDCSTLAVSAAFSPALVSAAPRARREVSLATVSVEELAKLTGSIFVAGGPCGPQALELVGVEWLSRPDARGSGEGSAAGEAFSLYFRGDPGQALAQDTYRFEHGRLGRFDMFIVPVDRLGADGCCYEAVFHRPTPASAPGAMPGRPFLSGLPSRPETT